MPDAQSILTPLQVPQAVKADAWDAVNSATNADDLTARLQKLTLPQSTKADLWDAGQARFKTGTAQQPPAPPSFWDSFKQAVTTNSPLNPQNWGAIIKSAFESPFSDENMAEAQRQADVFKAGKAPPLQPGEGASMAGEGAGQLTNAALMALITAGVVKGYGLASARAGALADAVSDPETLKVALKAIPGATNGKAAIDAISAKYADNFAARAKANAPVPVLRDAASPAWRNFQVAPPSKPAPVDPIPATRTPSGRIPGGIQNQVQAVPATQPPPVVSQPSPPVVPARATLAEQLKAQYPGMGEVPGAPSASALPEFDQATLDAAAQQLGGVKSWKALPDNGKQVVLNLLRAGKTQAAAPTPPAFMPQAAPPSQVVAPPSAPLVNGQPSIAEQLRDLLTQGQQPGSGGVVTIAPPVPDAEAVRGAMRGLPSGAPRAIADANYAADQEPTQAGVVYKAAAQVTKAQQFAQMIYDEGSTTAQKVSKWGDKAWKAAVTDRGMPNAFSDVSRGEVIAELKRLEGNVKQ